MLHNSATLVAACCLLATAASTRVFAQATSVASCPSDLGAVMTSRSALLDKVVPCTSTAAAVRDLKLLADKCTADSLQRIQAERLMLRLDSQLCTKKEKKATPAPELGPGPTHVPPAPPISPPAQKKAEGSLTDSRVGDARSLVDKTHRLLQEAEKQCRKQNQKACQDINQVQIELISSVTLYLSLLEKYGGDPNDARRLLASALSTDAATLMLSLDALRERGLSESDSRALLAGIVNRLSTDSNPQLLASALKELLQRATGSARSQLVDSTARLVQLLSTSGLSEKEVAQLVSGLSDASGRDPEHFKTLLDLARLVRNPKVLAVWNASLSTLLNRGGTMQPLQQQVQIELAKPNRDPNAILRVLMLMEEAEQKALARFGAVVAESQERQRVDASHGGLLKTSGNAIVLVTAPTSHSPGCDNPTGAFRLAIEQSLINNSLDGIRSPVEVPEEVFGDAVEEATAQCRGDLRGRGRWVPVIRGNCEGVYAIRLVEQGSTARAEGTLRYAFPLDKSVASKTFQNVSSEQFLTGCGPTEQTTQIAAASALLFGIQQRAWLVGSGVLPKGLIPGPPAPEPPTTSSGWYALAFAGAPYLQDSRASTASKVIPSILDGGLLIGAGICFGFAVKYRNDYAAGREQSLQPATAALNTGLVLGVGWAATRILSAVGYETTESWKRSKP